MMKWFRTVGLLEGLSFLVLLGIAMPMKYALGMREATQIPGMIHGLLFLGYIGLAHHMSDQENWPRKKLLLAYVASGLPFGTIVFDRKFLKT